MEQPILETSTFAPQPSGSAPAHLQVWVCNELPQHSNTSSPPHTCGSLCTLNVPERLFRGSGIRMWERVFLSSIWVRVFLFCFVFWRGNSENEQRGQTGWLEFSCSRSSFSPTLREPLLTPSHSLGRLSNPLEQSAPGTSAKTHAGSPL